MGRMRTHRVGSERVGADRSHGVKGSNRSDALALLVRLRNHPHPFFLLVCRCCFAAFCSVVCSCSLMLMLLCCAVVR